MTASRALLWTLALATLAWAIWVYPTIPERIPIHFGLDGLPDRWRDRSLAGWLLLPLIGVGLAAMMDGIAQWTLRHPEKKTINLPQADDLMALPVERRLPVLRRAVSMTNGMGIVMLAAFAVLQVGSYAAARGEPSQGWTLAGLAICLAVPLAVLVWGMTSISAEITRQKRAEAA